MNDPLNDHLIQRTVLVFTKTRHRATKICKILNGANIRAGEIHSDISQNKRESTLKQFRDGRISVLVATDIAARGLDVPSISHVVTYDLPLSAADYVHRIGRTGRAGRCYLGCRAPYVVSPVIFTETSRYSPYGGGSLFFINIEARTWALTPYDSLRAKRRSHKCRSHKYRNQKYRKQKRCSQKSGSHSRHGKRCL